MTYAVSKTMKRIFLVDDHPLLREGLSGHISGQLGMNVVGQAATAEEALAMIPGNPPDLVVMDLSLPDKSGLELIKELLSLEPDLLILIFSMHDEMFYAERVIRAGGRGYLMKGSPIDSLSQAIQRILAGELYLSSRVSNQMINGISGRKKNGEFGIARLSDREFEVFGLIGQGHTNQQIAEKLSISVRTVDAHRTNIKGKLNFPDGSTLVRMAILWVENENGVKQLSN